MASHVWNLRSERFFRVFQDALAAARERGRTSGWSSSPSSAITFT